MTQEEMMAAFAQMQAALEASNAKIAELEAAQTAKMTVSFKVGPSGAVSVYGLSTRGPTSLYYEQWIAILDKAQELRDFLETKKAERNGEEGVGLKLRNDPEWSESKAAAKLAYEARQAEKAKKTASPALATPAVPPTQYIPQGKSGLPPIGAPKNGAAK